MTVQKAPAYEEVARHLDNMFTSTFTFPSVRELKAKCGGEGSLSTYQAFKDRWLEDRLGGSGIQSILMAMRMERHTHASVMDALNGRLARLLQMFPGADRYSENNESDHRDTEPEPERRDGSGGAGSDSAAVHPPGSMDREDRGPDRAADIAAQSIARFTENDNSSANEAVLRETPPNASGYEAAKLTGPECPSNQRSSPSRSIGGGPQAVRPTGTTQPAKGEGDTNGGSTNGYA